MTWALFSNSRGPDISPIRCRHGRLAANADLDFVGYSARDHLGGDQHHHHRALPTMNMRVRGMEPMPTTPSSQAFASPPASSSICV